MLQVDNVLIEVDECTIHEISPTTTTSINLDMECCVGIRHESATEMAESDEEAISNLTSLSTAHVTATTNDDNDTFECEEPSASTTPAASDCRAVEPAQKGIKCLFCDQSGGVMAPVDTPDIYQGEEQYWAHIVCSLWDPDTVRCKSESVTRFCLKRRSLNARQTALCVFCGNVRGSLIKCRSLNCSCSFHAYCALHENNGRLERVQEARNICSKHAYCDRHHKCPITIQRFFDKLLTEPVVSLISDVRASLEEIQASLDSFDSINALVQAVADQLVSQTEAGAINQCDDMTTMPSFELHHLQVLEMFVDHFPQWQLVYDDFSLDVTSVIPQDIYQQLMRTFRPSRKSSKLAGPFRQDVVCDVCERPFHDLQPLFYCVNNSINGAGGHLQHWKCTKRKGKDQRDQVSDGGSLARTKLKKEPKTMSFVDNGVMKEYKLPKALPSLGDGSVVCGVCRSDIDVRAIPVTKRDWKRLGSLREPSKFAFSGCFVNEMERRVVSKTKSRAGRRGSKKKGQQDVQEELNDEDASSRGTSLAPQKMERLNVQRTMKWLVLISQIIKLAAESMQRETDLHQRAAADHDDAKHLVKRVKECRKDLMDQVNSIFDDVKQTVQPYDMYAWNQMEQAREMLETRSGPGICLLKHLVQEYTRFVFIKHKRAAEKASLEKQKREEQEAAHRRKLAQKQRDRQAELALKKQMLAMRKKQKESLTLAARSDTAPSSTRTSPASTPQRVHSPERKNVESSVRQTLVGSVSGASAEPEDSKKRALENDSSQATTTAVSEETDSKRCKVKNTH